MKTEGKAFAFVFVNVLARRKRVRMHVMESSQAKMTPKRAAKSPADTKLTATLLLKAPFLVLPVEVPGEVEGEEEEVDDERTVEGVEMGVGVFVVLVVVVWVLDVVEGREDVELKEPLLTSEELGGLLTELVEFRQVVASGRWV